MLEMMLSFGIVFVVTVAFIEYVKHYEMIACRV